MRVFLFLIVLLFYGCNSTITSSTSDDVVVVSDPMVDTKLVVVGDEFTNNDYIYSIPNDTVINTDVAKVAYRESSIPMLVVLVNYNNIQIKSTPLVWSDKLFGKNEHQLNDYYLEVSNGKFEFEKAKESYGDIDDGVVSVKLDRNHPNIDISSLSFSSKVYPDLSDSLKLANNYIDFSNYDSDGDGHITSNELILTFIIAGYEDSYEGRHVSNGIWAHQYCTSPSYTPTLDGVTIMGCEDQGKYALFGEKHNIMNPKDATIGIIAHELAHTAFSLPDLYNTADTSSGGIGFFGLMGAGSWAVQNGFEPAGNTPTHLSAWCKVFLGWITPVEDLGFVYLNETSSDDSNIVKIPISANHYYLLENRNNSGYDKGLYSLAGIFNGGIAIWHINENRLTYENLAYNSVNIYTDDKGVDLVEARDTGLDYNTNGGERALFYSPNITAFGTKITDISQRGSMMSLNIN